MREHTLLVALILLIFFALIPSFVFIIWFWQVKALISSGIKHTLWPPIKSHTSKLQA
jgi:hypothetical protein